MATTLLSQESSTSSDEAISDVLENAFGASKRMRQLNAGEFYAPSGPVRFLTQDPYLSSASSAIGQGVKSQMPHLLSFSESVVDQSTWERLSEVFPVQEAQGAQACEASLFDLVRNFVGSVATTALMGTDFTDTFPYALSELWSVDSKFNAMRLGVPRWVPYPGLVPSYAARRRLLLALESYHNAFVATEKGHNPGFDWQNMDDVSDVVRARMRALVDAKCSTRDAASEHLFFLWSLNVTTNTIIFWSLVHILSDSALHETILKEITTHVKAVRPDPRETGFNIPEPPRLSLNIDGLVKSCPSLKATYHECLRLYSSNMTYRKLSKDLTFTESAEDAASANRKRQNYRCIAGDFVAVPHYLLNKNALHFPDPETFNAQRFMPQHPENSNGGDAVASDGDEDDTLISGQHKPNLMDDIWPKDIDHTTHFSRSFAERQALSFLAGFLALWDIERADGKSWEVPQSKDGSTTRVPKKDIRVQMKLRV